MPKTIIIDGVIGWDISPRNVRNKLNNAGGQDVEIQISSPGGFVFDGLEIFNLIKNYSGKTTTRMMGLAASMASYIALASDIVEIERNAVFMIHNPWVLAVGDQNDLRKTADDLEGLSNLLAREYAKKSGKKFDEIKSLLDADSYFFGEEIVNNGFADKIVDGEGDEIKKEDAITQAKLSIQNCYGVMKDSKKNENDLEKAAAYLNVNDVQIENKDLNLNQNIVVQDENSKTGINSTKDKSEEIQKKNKTKEIKSMTKEEFRLQHPEAYSAIVAEGVDQENKRCTSYAEAMIALPTCKTIYLDAIKDKKDANDASVMASVIALTTAKKEIKGNETENVKDVEAGETEETEEAKEKALLAQVMAKSRNTQGVK